MILADDVSQAVGSAEVDLARDQQGRREALQPDRSQCLAGAGARRKVHHAAQKSDHGTLDALEYLAVPTVRREKVL
ncbi:hypothetical protein ACM42_02060 [Bradyrhizobium sp. CCBAU 25338]|uniref:hypothetical protein n=1 Tax=Bradyrhizobium nanningense TaxID=1325118 RepID=UPI00102605DB|nr:hypothetical protein [Bradyrhizobium nanningense]MDA9399859.1 hypothetical protein [Bradyrhizobium sp. CCBAU 45389]MDA9527250.1 hypothetical protein [Bradyrhizobium sp. CCBAU 25338]RXH32430.1 hypothetical protein XH84_14720 [Bradyrhizobium nanningense]